MEKDLGKITKNATSDIVVRIDDFGGKRGLTIREFVTSERYTGFTKAGVRIPSSEFQKFKKMINSISDKDMEEAAKPEEEESEKEDGEAEKEELPDY